MRQPSTNTPRSQLNLTSHTTTRQGELPLMQRHIDNKSPHQTARATATDSPWLGRVSNNPNTPKTTHNVGLFANNA